jgi:hypothetical protein
MFGKKNYLLFFCIGVLIVMVIGIVYALCGGCEENGECYNVGDELVIGDSQKYCDLTGEFVLQKQDGEVCDNDFECLNDLCSNRECVDLYGEIIEGEDFFTIEVFVVTLKDEYSVGEKIELK